MRKVTKQPSWSHICRMSCKRYIDQINRGEACIDWTFANIACSYRPRIYRERTAKLLRRAIRAGRVHESETAARLYKKELASGRYYRPDYL